MTLSPGKCAEDRRRRVQTSAAAKATNGAADSTGTDGAQMCSSVNRVVNRSLSTLLMPEGPCRRDNKKYRDDSYCGTRRTNKTDR